MPQPTQQPIVGYFQDDENHWVAKLACGHNQHVRHNPPLVSRPWVLTQTGLDDKVGVMLVCTKCIAGVSPDRQFSSMLAKEAA